VRDNVIYRNDKVGIVFGGFSASVGRVKNCSFTNNTLYQNDTLGEGFGELWIQFAEDNVVDYNLWLTTAGTPTFVWNGIEYNGLAAFQAGSGQETHALTSDPQFVN